MSILYLILAIIIDIAIVTFPIYFASKLVSKHSSIGRAIIAAILGPIVFLIFYALVGYLLSSITSYFYIVALVIAFLVLIYFYSVIFETSFAGGILISHNIHNRVVYNRDTPRQLCIHIQDQT